MKIQRLSWAGLKIESEGQILLIDAVETYLGKGAAVGPADPYLFSGNTKADVILITHLHSDHYDKDVIDKSLATGGQFITSDQIVDELKNDGLNPLGLALGQSHQVGNFTVTPVFAMDGIGDKQVSWVIEDGEHRILHGGDTLWHTQFWNIAKQFKHFDAAFLPINAPVLNIPRLTFSPVPITLTPFQALAATKLLHADTLVPIHYGFNHPGVYEQYPNMFNELTEQSEKQHVPFELLEVGDFLTIIEKRNS